MIDLESFDNFEFSVSTLNVFTQRSLPTSCHRLIVPSDQNGNKKEHNQVSMVHSESPNPPDINPIDIERIASIIAKSIRLILIFFLRLLNHYCFRIFFRESILVILVETLLWHSINLLFHLHLLHQM